MGFSVDIFHIERFINSIFEKILLYPVSQLIRLKENSKFVTLKDYDFESFVYMRHLLHEISVRQ